MGKWASDHGSDQVIMVMWTYGDMGIWAYEHMAYEQTELDSNTPWSFDHMVIKTYGHMAIWGYAYGHKDIWTYGVMDI